MTHYDQFKQSVHDGERGGNKGIPMGMPRLGYLINGIQKKRYDLLFSSEGVGKSSFVTNSYVLNPYEWYVKNNPKIDLQILWFSLEVDLISILSKAFCWKMYKESSVLTSPNVIQSKGDYKIPSIAKNKIVEYEPYFQKMLQRVHIIDAPMSPDDIKNYVENFASHRGYYKKDSNGVVRYIPHNPNEHIIVIVDTIGNMKIQNVDGRFDKKGTIDYHSSLCRDIYRNRMGYTVCNVAHSNRSISGMDRAKYGEIFPNKDDIKESSQPSADANTVIALFNPMDHLNSNNALDKFMGYDIGQLRDRFRAVGILKNREGPSNKRVGCLYLGENGYFQELPPPDQMQAQYYDFINKVKQYEGE